MAIFDENSLKKNLDSNVTNLVSISIDAIHGGLPIASITHSLGQSATSLRDRSFIRKLESFLSAVGSADPVLTAQTLENLRSENGPEYFDDVLFNSIDASNSSEMAKFLGIALKKCAQGTITKASFWAIAHCLKSLTVHDVNVVKSCEHKHISSSKVDITQRLQSVGLARYQVVYGGGRAEWNEALTSDFFQIVCDTDSPPKFAKPTFGAGDRVDTLKEDLRRRKKMEGRKLGR